MMSSTSGRSSPIQDYVIEDDDNMTEDVPIDEDNDIENLSHSHRSMDERINAEQMPSTADPHHSQDGSFCKEFWSELKSLLAELIQHNKTKSKKKKFLTVIMIVSSLLVFYDLIFGGTIYGWLASFIHWMAEHEAQAVFAFIGIFVVSTRESKVIELISSCSRK